MSISRANEDLRTLKAILSRLWLDLGEQCLFLIVGNMGTHLVWAERPYATPSEQVVGLEPVLIADEGRTN